MKKPERVFEDHLKRKMFVKKGKNKDLRVQTNNMKYQDVIEEVHKIDYTNIKRRIPGFEFHLNELKEGK